jgi:hypothetical protein
VEVTTEKQKITPLYEQAQYLESFLLALMCHYIRTAGEDWGIVSQMRQYFFQARSQLIVTLLSTEKTCLT